MQGIGHARCVLAAEVHALEHGPLLVRQARHRLMEAVRELMALCLLRHGCPRVDEILLKVSALEILLHAGDIDLPLAPQEVHHAAADAVLAASIFHYRTHTIQQAKTYLRERGVPVRLEAILQEQTR